MQQPREKFLGPPAGKKLHILIILFRICNVILCLLLKSPQMMVCPGHTSPLCQSTQHHCCILQQAEMLSQAEQPPTLVQNFPRDLMWEYSLGSTPTSLQPCACASYLASTTLGSSYKISQRIRLMQPPTAIPGPHSLPNHRHHYCNHNIN